jgi:protein TonB
VEVPQQTTQIEIVDDNVETQDLNINAEVEQNEVIEEYVPVEVEEDEVVEQEIFQIVEEMPSFPGGDQKMMEYVAKNIKYPQIARETGVQGKVFVNFVVEPDGSVSNVKILRGIGGGCDEEAMRVVKSMPKWKPGKQRGKPVRVSYNLPVNFRLQ